MKYARGKKAWGECARSGRRMLLRDMSADPRTGLLVDPSWAERKDVVALRQLQDGIVLRRPSPARDRIATTYYPNTGTGNVGADGEPIRPLIVYGAGGTATLVAT